MDHQIEAERIFAEYMNTTSGRDVRDGAIAAYPPSNDEEDIEWQIERVHTILDDIEANHKVSFGDDDWNEIEAALIGMLIDEVG